MDWLVWCLKTLFFVVTPKDFDLPLSEAYAKILLWHDPTMAIGSTPKTVEIMI